MASLYFYQYNNYYNRQVRQEDTISDYGTPVYTETGNNLNFNPNDGVMARYVAGRAGNPYSGNADYVIYSEDNINFTSRWFIIEQERSLKGQYNVTLRRDVLVDYYSQVLNATTFIEKAVVPDSNNLIFNDEAITVNQIKTSQTSLYDDTGCGWIVGYVDRNYNRETEDSISFNAVAIEDYIYADKASFDADYPYRSYINSKSLYLESGIKPILRVGTIRQYETVQSVNRVPSLLYNMKQDIWESTQESIGETSYIYKTHYTGNMKNYLSNNYNRIVLIQNYSTYVTDRIITKDIYQELLQQEGKIVKIGDNYYRLKANIDFPSKVQYPVTSGTIYTYMNGIMNSYPGKIGTGTAYYDIEFTNVNGIQLELEEVTSGDYKATISKLRYPLRNEPYDMFCIPYAPNTLNNGVAKIKTAIADTSEGKVAFDLSISNSLALSCAQGIQQKLNTNCYDIQLLPYCPFTGYTMTKDAEGNSVITMNSNDSNRYTIIKDSKDINRAVMIWCVSNKVSKHIIKGFTFDNFKIENQCRLYRLCSPNFNGQYEFNLAKVGPIFGWQVRCTYLPYQPFIQVQPDFGDRMYGGVYQDARGLICGGSFSITQISNVWANYVNNNKNYNNIFDRQIENMEVNRKYQRIDQAANIVAGTLGAGISKGIGAGIATGVAGIADFAIGEKLYSEAVDYKKDMFGYQLDNIRAMPNSIAKTTGFTIINTIVPVVEYYTCSDPEIQAVANKIAWNGMTVMVIGSIADYIGNTWSYRDPVTKEMINYQGYIKGRLIRIEGINDDFHLVNAISDELYKGAYYK